MIMHDSLGSMNLTLRAEPGDKDGYRKTIDKSQATMH